VFSLSNGVVHVGAHCGEEIEEYAGRSPIICFEPQATIFPEGVIWANFALGDHHGVINLFVPWRIHGDGLDTQMASAYPLIEEVANEIGWSVTRCEVIPVPVTRFDLWAMKYFYKEGSCSLLVIDAHGMELEVLEGFGRYLISFTDLKIECCEVSPWDGGCSAYEVEEFLKGHGFKRTSPILSCGDVFFTKELQ
jgi:hypothetical protein